MPSIPTRLLIWVGLVATLTHPIRAQVTPVGVFDGQQDIGAVLHPGSGTFTPARQDYTLTGSGTNIWGTADEFHFLWKRLKGDFILYTRGNLVGKGVDPHRKIGWMARTSLDPNSAQVNAAVHGDGLTSLQFRRTTGAVTEENRAVMTGADVIQLERRGNTFTMRVAKFGQPFEVRETADISLGDEVYIGLFIGSHNKDVTETTTFRDVRISVPVGANVPAGRMELGSRMEVLDIATGNREVVYTAPNSIQAPNWTRDAKSLVYNSEGLMYTFDISSRKAKVLPTGDVKNNNNDHVLAPDGKTIGLSSGVSALGGSIIYTVPVRGGAPKQITPKGPSYLHGWSPDGKDLVFCGSRDGEYDVYKVPAAGGPEIRLTDAKGLDDGPEYSPDGKYIYFNSNRTGTMQIWRMKPDGTGQEAVTDGEFHDWFAHVSPDGKWLVFLSFLKDEVKPGDHPAYKHVYIRLMPVSGGQPKVIAYLYGGQGSVNTPSWSPDSKRIAFVSNTDANVINAVEVAKK